MVAGFGEHVAPAAGSQTGAFAMWNLWCVIPVCVLFHSFHPMFLSHCPLTVAVHICFLCPCLAFNVHCVFWLPTLHSMSVSLCFASPRCVQQPRWFPVPCTVVAFGVCCLSVFVSVSVSLVRKGIAGHHSSPTSVAVALLCMVPVCCFAGLS